MITDQAISLMGKTIKAKHETLIKANQVIGTLHAMINKGIIPAKEKDAIKDFFLACIHCDLLFNKVAEIKSLEDNIPIVLKAN
jgi:hypothetical protein